MKKYKDLPRNVKLNYPLRIGTTTHASILTISLSYHHGFNFWQLCLIVLYLIWPHVAYVMAVINDNPEKVERKINLYLDLLILGWWITANSFSLWPSVVVPSYVIMYMLAANGITAYIKGLFTIILGIGSMGLVAGFNFHPESNLLTASISILGLFISGISFGFLNYKLRKSILKEKLKIESLLIERNEVLTQLNEELAEAAGYVKNMLPMPLNEGPVKTDWRYFPSTALGGDAFGYQWIDEDHFSIYLLDVSGHGVGAALLSVSVMNTLRSQTLPNTDFKDCKQVLESLNTAFPGEDNNDMFFTIWYGVYKKSTRELTYASGGHPPALLFGGNADGNSEAKLLRTPCYVIGGTADTTYKKQECEIGKDNKLYIFSDGVYEVEKSDGSMWRFKEFADFMIKKCKTNDQSTLDHLYRYANKLNQADEFEDDFTIVEVSFS